VTRSFLPLVSEINPKSAGGPHEAAVQCDSLQPTDRVGERNGAYLLPSESYHFTEIACGNQFYSDGAEHRA